MTRALMGSVDEGGAPQIKARQAAYRPRSVLYSVAALSLVAGLIYLWVTPEHLEEWWGYGTFFLIAAVAQTGYVPLVLRWPNRTVLVLGIAGNSAIILLYPLTRVVGIPLFGPEATVSAYRGLRLHLSLRPACPAIPMVHAGVATC